MVAQFLVVQRNDDNEIRVISRSTQPPLYYYMPTEMRHTKILRKIDPYQPVINSLKRPLKYFTTMNTRSLDG